MEKGEVARNVKQQAENYAGPCREKARTLLERCIKQLETKLAGLRELREMCPDSGPGEEAFWEILQRAHRWIHEI